MASPRFYRRSLLICAGLLVAVAVVVAVGIIPPVGADTSPHATPQGAVPAFWINVGLNFLAATFLVFLAIRTPSRKRFSITVLSLLAFVALLLAFALTDAALAFRSHGPAMHAATILLYLSSAIDLLAAVLIITTAIRFPKHA